MICIRANRPRNKKNWKSMSGICIDRKQKVRAAKKNKSSLSFIKQFKNLLNYTMCNSFQITPLSFLQKFALHIMYIIHCTMFNKHCLYVTCAHKIDYFFENLIFLCQNGSHMFFHLNCCCKPQEKQR